MAKQNFWHRYSGYLFAAPYLVLMAVFLLGPLCFGLALSFVRWEMLSPLPPEPVGFANYTEALNDEYFWLGLRATLLFTIITVPLTVGLALLVAAGLNSLTSRQALYRAAFIIPMMINITVVGILWRWLLNPEFRSEGVV